MKLMGTSKLTAIAALFAGVVMTTAAGAAPAMSSQAVAQQVNGKHDQLVQTVRDGRGRGDGWRGNRHHGGGWGGGGWAAGAAAGLLLGGGYGLYGYDGYDDDDYAGGGYGGRSYAYDGEGGVERCQATFRSFDLDSGTYMGYDGIRRPCPYL